MTFSTAELEEYSEFVQRLASAARSQTLPRFRNKAMVFNKAGPWYDPVTDADREAERALREMIAKVYSKHAILGEEFGLTPGDGPWRWVLDPVDGTRAFVTGSLTWTTLIALEHNEKPVLGLIDQPYTDEIWLAAGNGAQFHHRGNVIDCKTSDTTQLEKARLSTTDPTVAGYFNDRQAKAFEELSQATRLARFSMDAYAYGLLALGELDLVVEAGLQHHDYAALIPIVEGAGGVITNWRGDAVNADEGGEVVAAATAELHAAALTILNAA